MTAIPPNGDQRSRAILVVGAGRSGTSAVTRGLAALGVVLGDRLKPATAKNPTGFWEDRDLLRVGKNARAALGLRAESVSLVEDESWDDPILEPHIAEAAAIIEQRFSHEPLWAFKYAQTLRLLPFWLAVLERAHIEPSWLVASRNPLSVARSRRKLDAVRGSQGKSDLEWLASVVPYFRRMTHQSCVVVDFDRLMQSPVEQLMRIARALDIPVDDAVRTSARAFGDSFLIDGMRHTLYDAKELASDTRINPLTRDAFLWLDKLSRDEIDLEDARFVADWARIERELGAQAPLLRYVDELTQELRRAERSGLRGLRVRALEQLKRVRPIAAAFGALKLRRDVSRSAGGRGASPGP